MDTKDEPPCCLIKSNFHSDSMTDMVAPC